MTVTPGDCGRVSWELPGAPDNGWDEVTFPFTVHTAPEEPGWHFAQQFAFVGGGLGNVGIRPYRGGHQLAAFSVFGDGVTVVDTGRCQHDDSSVTCSAWAPFIRHREYLYTVYRSEPGSRVWQGLLADGDTGEQWPLGAWALPHDGGLKSSQVGFMEYCKSVVDCAALPRASLHFGAPYNSVTGTTGRTRAPTASGRCAGKTNYGAEANRDGRVWMRNGWPVRLGKRGTRESPVNITVTINIW